MKYKFVFIYIIIIIITLFVLKTNETNSFSFQQNQVKYCKVNYHLNGSKLQQNCNETNNPRIEFEHNSYDEKTKNKNNNNNNNNNKKNHAIVNENESRIKKNFHVNIKEVFDKSIRQMYDKSLLFNFAVTPWASPLCKAQIEQVKNELKNLNVWALKMLDSSARLPSGILNGNLNQYGDFDQCLGINEKEFNIQGQYCLANLQPKFNYKSKELNELFNLLKSHEAFKSDFNDVGHRIPKFSLINWGICMPASCTARDVEYSLSKFVNNFTNPLELDVRVESFMCQTDKPIDWAFSFVITNSFFIFIFSIAIMSTLYDFSLEINKNEFLKAFSLKKNLFWLLDTKPSSDDISAVHGIRFVNALMLLLSHKSMAAIFNPFVNRTFLAESLGQTWTVIGRAASLYTDPFLLISGMLTSYSILGRLEKGRKISITNEWITRLIRILPPVVALMLLCTFIIPKIGSGPQWNLVVGTHSNLCKNNWWRLLLFIQNYFGFSEMCLTHTHHLGIDTELFFICPLIVLGLWKWPKQILYLLFALICIGTVGRFYTSLINELANYVYFGVSIKQLFRTADFVYTFPPYRSSVYIMGVLLGYVLRKFKCISLTRKQLIIGWTIAVISFSLTLALPAPMGKKNYKYNAIHAALYSAFAPLSWCSVFSWIVFVSHLGYKNFITRILSWKGFLISTKLSYSLYLTQFPVFFYNVGTKRNSDYYYNFYSIMIDLNEFFLVLVCSVLLTLLFDAPFQNIKKLVWKR